jgi:shikimate kinase
VTAVVLVGLMGAGKSSVGSEVAARMGMTFVDVDVAIVERTGKTVRELWERGGESAYRHLESKVVLDTLAEKRDVVLAAPGGVVLDPVVRTALANAFVVWLRTDPATLASRVRLDDHRPLLGEHPQDVLTTMAHERSGIYEDLADLAIDTDHEDVEAIASRIVSALDDRTSPDRP